DARGELEARVPRRDLDHGIPQYARYDIDQSRRSAGHDLPVPADPDAAAAQRRAPGGFHLARAFRLWRGPAVLPELARPESVPDCRLRPDRRLSGPGTGHRLHTAWRARASGSQAVRRVRAGQLPRDGPRAPHARWPLQL